MEKQSTKIFKKGKTVQTSQTTKEAKEILLLVSHDWKQDVVQHSHLHLHLRPRGWKILT